MHDLFQIREKVDSFRLRDNRVVVIVIDGVDVDPEVARPLSVEEQSTFSLAALR